MPLPFTPSALDGGCVFLYEHIYSCSKKYIQTALGWHFAPLLSKNVTHCPRRFMNGSAVQARLAVLFRLNCLHMPGAVVKHCFFGSITFESLQHVWYDFNRLLGEYFFRETIQSLGPFHCGLLPVGPLLDWARPGIGARSAVSATSSRVRSAFFS